MILAGAALLSAACGQPSANGKPDAGPQQHDAGIPPADAGIPPADAGAPDAGVSAHFEPDALPTGAALWLQADLSDAKAPKLEVWAQGISPIFGLAFHLGLDPAQLKVETAGAEPVMGLDGRYLQKARGGDVAFGLTHVEAASGETDLTAAKRIAVLQLSVLGPVDSRLTLGRVLARKADGSFVAVSVAAGRLVLPGGAP
jgi:hypothetical protein